MKSILFFLFVVCSQWSIAQIFTSKENHVSFYSSTKMEDIKAWNVKSLSVLNLDKNEIAISIPINQFEFDRSLMKEHFNEKYLESEKYPRAKFQGKIVGFDLNRNGIQNITVTGKLTMHGHTKHISISGTMEKVNDLILAVANFSIKLDDYKIEIPRLLWQNIAEAVDVTTSFTYKRLQ